MENVFSKFKHLSISGHPQLKKGIIWGCIGVLIASIIPTAIIVGVKLLTPNPFAFRPVPSDLGIKQVQPSDIDQTYIENFSQDLTGAAEAMNLDLSDLQAKLAQPVDFDNDGVINYYDQYLLINQIAINSNIKLLDKAQLKDTLLCIEDMTVNGINGFNTYDVDSPEYANFIATNPNFQPDTYKNLTKEQKLSCIKKIESKIDQLELAIFGTETVNPNSHFSQNYQPPTLAAKLNSAETETISGIYTVDDLYAYAAVDMENELTSHDETSYQVEALHSL
jgi:hypothetical protein